MIRRFRREDIKQLLTLFRETILSINLGDYTEEQVAIWAGNNLREEEWINRYLNSITYVAELDGKIVGFCNYNDQAIVDMLYVHKDYQREGIATKLLEQVENHAKLNGYEKLHTEASITAKPFFAYHGYVVIKKQVKTYKHTEFVNFIMEKRLKRG